MTWFDKDLQVWHMVCLLPRKGAILSNPIFIVFGPHIIDLVGTNHYVVLLSRSVPQLKIELELELDKIA